MDRHTFLSYLRQPARLSEISLEELLRLVDRYPYATDVMLLVVLKAKQTGSSDYDRYLSRLAAATFDRPQLFDILQELETQPVAEGGEVLELMQLEELELAPLNDPFEEIPSRLNENAAPPPNRIEGWPAEPTTETRESPPIEKVRSQPAPVVIEEHVPDKLFSQATLKAPPTGNNAWVATAVAYHRAITPGGNPEVGKPEDPARFAHVNSLAAVRYDLTSRLLELRRRSGEETTARVTAASPAVVSETLADLLVRQGQYSHAVRMYRRLMLLYPEKKTIFAGLIEELKEKQ